MVDLFCTRMVFAMHTLQDKVIGDDAEIAFEFLYRFQPFIEEYLPEFAALGKGARNEFFGTAATDEDFKSYW